MCVLSEQQTFLIQTENIFVQGAVLILPNTLKLTLFRRVIAVTKDASYPTST